MTVATAVVTTVVSAVSFGAATPIMAPLAAAGISAATSVISAAGGLAGSALNGIGGVGGAVLKTGVSVATSTTSTVATKAIESRGDWNVFSESMGSFDTWSGLISSGAGSLVTSAISYGLTGETTFNVLNIADFINPNSEIAGAGSGLL